MLNALVLHLCVCVFCLCLVMFIHTQAPTEQLLAGSSEAASSGRRRRRRLQAGSQHWRRQLQAVGGGIPVIPSDKAQQEALPPTVSPLMGLQDMLCWVKPFSPTGLQGMLIPPNRNYSAMAKKAAGTAHAITCPARPKPAIFRYNNIVFKRVKIPVVFHCECDGVGWGGVRWGWGGVGWGGFGARKRPWTGPQVAQGLRHPNKLFSFQFLANSLCMCACLNRMRNWWHFFHKAALRVCCSCRPTVLGRQLGDASTMEG